MTDRQPDQQTGGQDDRQPEDVGTELGTTEQEPETFDRTYVQQLRDEAAGYRVRARRADDYATALVTAYAALTGRLADPDDLPVTVELLAEPTPEAVTAAVDALLQRKPHLATRRPAGDAGQGVRTDRQPVTLLGMLNGGVH